MSTYCNQCGTPMPDNLAYCPNCGTPRSVGTGVQQPADNYQQTSYEQPAYGAQQSYGTQQAYGAQQAYGTQQAGGAQQTYDQQAGGYTPFGGGTQTTPPGYSSGAIGINNNLLLAVFCTLCCCNPIGVYAMIRANSCNIYARMGAFDDAQKAADDAKKWSLIGIGIVVVCWLLYGMFYLILGASILSAFGSAMRGF